MKINKRENRKMREKINLKKKRFFQKMNKINKLLARLANTKRERTQEDTNHQ